MEIFRAIAAEHEAPEGDLSTTLAASDAGAYVLTSNATVVERLLDEEAPVYQALAAKLGHDIDWKSTRPMATTNLTWFLSQFGRVRGISLNSPEPNPVNPDPRGNRAFPWFSVVDSTAGDSGYRLDVCFGNDSSVGAAGFAFFVDVLGPQINQSLKPLGTQVVGAVGDWRGFNPVLRAKQVVFPAGNLVDVYVELDFFAVP